LSAVNNRERDETTANELGAPRALSIPPPSNLDSTSRLLLFGRVLSYGDDANTAMSWRKADSSSSLALLEGGASLRSV
jgi:hypothetical protein